MKDSSCIEKVILFIERNLLFLKFLIGFICMNLAFLIYTYDRSFRVHQETLSRILHTNNRQGIFCSRVHVGHDGTTLDFQPIPPEVGSAGGVIDSNILLSGPSPIDPFVFLLILYFLISVILIFWCIRKARERDM